MKKKKKKKKESLIDSCSRQFLFPPGPSDSGRQKAQSCDPIRREGKHVYRRLRYTASENPRNSVLVKARACLGRALTPPEMPLRPRTKRSVWRCSGLQAPASRVQGRPTQVRCESPSLYDMRQH